MLKAHIQRGHGPIDQRDFAFLSLHMTLGNITSYHGYLFHVDASYYSLKSATKCDIRRFDDSTT